MPARVVTESIITVGEESIVDSASPRGRYLVVFEDDGETGYFYACDTSRGEAPVVDAMHVYNVADVLDKGIPSDVQIAWSEDGLKAALYINDYPHAVFDFMARRGYCRTNFPMPSTEWAQHHDSHEWDDAALGFFR